MRKAKQHLILSYLVYIILLITLWILAPQIGKALFSISDQTYNNHVMEVTNGKK